MILLLINVINFLILPLFFVDHIIHYVHLIVVHINVLNYIICQIVIKLILQQQQLMDVKHLVHLFIVVYYKDNLNAFIIMFNIITHVILIVLIMLNAHILINHILYQF